MISISIEEAEKLRKENKALIKEKRTDEEIIALMEKQMINQEYDYVEKRLYGIENFYDVKLRRPLTIPSVKEVENDAIKRHLRNEFDNLNIDIYLAFFNKYSVIFNRFGGEKEFNTCVEWISYFCDNKNVEKLSDEQVIAIYKVFPYYLRSLIIFNKTITKRLKKIIMDGKFDDVINKNDEILMLVEGKSSFLSLGEAKELITDYNDLKYIVSNVSFEPCFDKRFTASNICYILENKKQLVNREIKNILFNKLSELSEYELSELLLSKAMCYDYNVVLEFDFVNVLNEKQLNSLFRKLYKATNIFKNELNKKQEFIEFFKKSKDFKSKESQRSVITDEILNEMIDIGPDAIKTHMSLIYSLNGNKKFLLSKKTKERLLAKINESTLFFQSLLECDYQSCQYEFDFIKSNIIDEIGEEKIFKQFHKELSAINHNFFCGYFSDYVCGNKFSKIISNVVNHISDESENHELVKKVLNEDFCLQYRCERSEENKYSNLKEYLNENSFKYLDTKNKNKLLEYIFKQKIFYEYIKIGDRYILNDNYRGYEIVPTDNKVANLILGKHISYETFMMLWNDWLGNENTLRFYLIDSILSNSYDTGIKLDERFNNVISEYLGANKSEYVSFVKNELYRPWTDIEIAYICETESVNTISEFLRNKYRFTEKQWDKLFRHFYKMDFNPFVPLYSNIIYYDDFDTVYNMKVTKKVKYKDFESINIKDPSEVNGLIKKMEKKSSKVISDYSDDGLPF